MVVVAHSWSFVPFNGGGPFVLRIPLPNTSRDLLYGKEGTIQRQLKRGGRSCARNFPSYRGFKKKATS